MNFSKRRIKMSNSRLKESNIEWLGKIPKNWKLMHNKYLLKKKKSIISKYNNEKILSLTMNGVIERDLTAGGKMPSSFNGYQKLEKGNLLLCLFDIDVTPRCVGIIPTNGITSPAYSQFILNKGKANLKYYYYYFLMLDNQKTLVHLSKNLRNTLSEQEFGNLISLCPPLKEQKQIADFLDKKVSQIDDISKKIQQEITDLEEYRKSIITKAVTTGLNTNIQMKDSNIDYINKIPNTWHLTRLKYILTERNQRSIDGKELLLSVSQKKGILPAYQVKRSIKANSLVGYKIVKQNDLVFNKLNPALARFGVSNYNGITSPDFSVYYSNKINIQFLSFLLKTSKYVTEYKRLCSGVGEGYTRLYTPTLYNIKVALPTIKEQNKIVNILNKKDQKIKKLMEKQKRLLLTLTQYKQSLIYEYVTGKKQVSSKESAKA